MFFSSCHCAGRKVKAEAKKADSHFMANRHRLGSSIMLVPEAVPPCKVILQILKSTQLKANSYYTACSHKLLNRLMDRQRKTASTLINDVF